LLRKYLRNGLIGALAFVCVGAGVVRGADNSSLVPSAAASSVATPSPTAAPRNASDNSLSSKITSALEALTSAVRPLSHPKALETAFHSYFAYLNAHPDVVKKPLLYFVDYGLSSTEPRGYVFNMSTLHIVEGPFTVAHGRGSSTTQYGVPTRFSNGSGSAMTSLGLYVTQSLYQFTGHTGGQAYSSVGLRLQGVSPGLNDNAFARGVVAHGAPYVTATKAGRSEGCPAMEQQRAERVLPELANGAMVYLYAPNQNLDAND
jgi:L,D-transpeptidase catalytic domain